MCDPGIEFPFRASVCAPGSAFRFSEQKTGHWPMCACACGIGSHSTLAQPSTPPNSKLEDKTHPALACLLSLSAATMRSRCAVAVPGVPRARARMAWIFADSRAAV
jgi:hypothetical protein